MLKIKSLIGKCRERNRRRGRMGVEARIRKIAEAPAPMYPAVRTGDYRIVHIEDCAGGRITEHILMLLPVQDGAGRCDQWHAWLDAGYEGVMGWDRAMAKAQGQFGRMRTLHG